MSPSALTRMAAICRAEFGQFLEHIEDPRKLVAQSVRDMEACVERAVVGLGQATAGERRLNKKHAANEARIIDCQRAAEGALAEGDEAAARLLLVKKAQLVQRGEELALALADREGMTAQLRAQLHGLHARLEQAKEREKALRLRMGTGAPMRGPASGVEGAEVVRARFADIEERVRECERDVARFEERAMAVEAEAEARCEWEAVDARARTLETLEAERRVDEQLASMRAKVNQ